MRTLDDPSPVRAAHTNHVGYGSTRRLAPYTIAMTDPSERRHDMGRRYIDREVEHLRQIITQRLDLEKAALELQALEIERRLGDLNHAHEKAAEAAALTISRDQFDEYVKAQEQKGTVAKRAYVTAGIAVAGMLLTLALTIAGWMRTP